MSMTIFPATPGTYIINREQGEKFATLIPVVGFHHIQGNIVFPLTLMPGGGLTIGRALMTADGFVNDPAFGEVFESKDEWMQITNSPGYWETKSKMPPAEMPLWNGLDAKVTIAPAGIHGEKTNEVEVRISRPKAIPDKPARTDRAARVFKTNSWWQNERDHEIKQIDGGEQVPFENDPVWQKVGLIDYKARKKDGWVVVKNVDIGPAAGSFPVYADEDDDGADLI